MKINTSELQGPALDWAVAKCNGKTLHYFVDDWFKKDPWLAVNGEADQPLHSYTPTTDWGQGGLLIEQEEISIVRVTSALWDAHMSNVRFFESGPTQLIAAMRCFVASKLGDEVDVPEELK